MDMDTFLTTLYVLIDDWYQAEMAEQLKRRAGPPLRMSDSEVLTIAIASRWRAGVPWHSERGIGRYLEAHGRQWFPQLLKRTECAHPAVVERDHCLTAVAGAVLGQPSGSL